MRSGDLFGLAIWSLLLPLALGQERCLPAIQTDRQPQVFILSDISNEPDDTMSFIRLLLHSDQYNITGMVAVTSTWLNSSVFPDQILNTTTAYGLVVDNLDKHSAGKFPTAEYLASVVKAGQPVYGTAAIGISPLSSGASHLISVVDGLSSDDILYVQAWGGINTLAEALFQIRSTRTQHDVDTFVSKLRVYAISDQDNAGIWIRREFPTIPYIVSLHTFNQYKLATWSGISGDAYYSLDPGGPDTSLVTQEYVSEHFQIGPLGSHYPDIAYIMEGDSPSIMYTMQNGLNGGPFDHPEWGGWGGRYNLLDPSRQTAIYSDTTDAVIGIDNKTHVTNHATIWRWRQAYQEEMTARVQWSVQSSYDSGSHPPVVAVNGSCGSEPLVLEVSAEQAVRLDGTGTWDPDANLTGHESGMQFKWFQYRDVSASQANVAATVPQLNFTLSEGGQVVDTTMPSSEKACTAIPDGSKKSWLCQEYHIIFEVAGSGSPPIRRYKRVILKMQPPSGNTAKSKRDEL